MANSCLTDVFSLSDDGQRREEEQLEQSHEEVTVPRDLVEEDPLIVDIPHPFVSRD